MKNFTTIAAIGAALLLSVPAMAENADVTSDASRLLNLWNPANWCELSPVCDPAPETVAKVELVGNGPAATELSNAFLRWEDCTKAIFVEGGVPDECKTPFFRATLK